MQNLDFYIAVIGKDFRMKRLCPVCKIFNETSLALGHSLYMEMSSSSKNVIGHTVVSIEHFLMRHLKSE